MSIPYPALKPMLAASVLPEEEPIRVPPGPDQQVRLAELREALLPESPHAHITSWDDRHVLHFSVGIPTPEPHTYRSYRYSIHLQLFFSGDTLHVSTGHRSDGAPCAGLPQLRRLSAAIRARLSDAWKREQKRDKIRQLRERSIEAQIDEIADRMQFEYGLRKMHTKVVLVVRLDGVNGLYVDIPHHRIQESLEEVERLVDTVRGLYARGVRFKVAGAGGRDFRKPRPA